MFSFLFIILTFVFINNLHKDIDYRKAALTCKNTLLKEKKLNYNKKDEITILCIKKIIRDSLKNNEIKEAAKELTILASEDNIFYGYCHLSMHLLGTELLKHFNTIENAITNVNFIDCGNGLAHGILDQWATNKITLEEFISAIRSCEEIEKISPGGCAEGIGHASYQSRIDLEFNDRIKNALSICNNFIMSTGGWHCAYGAMMQPFFKQNPELIEEKQIYIPDSKDLIMLCERYGLKVDYVYSGCISGAGWLMGLKETLITLKLVDNIKIEKYITSDRFIENIYYNILVCDSLKDNMLNHNCKLQMFSRLPLQWYTGNKEFVKNCENLKLSIKITSVCLAGGYEFIPPVEYKKILIDNNIKYNVWPLVEERWIRERGDKISFTDI